MAVGALAFTALPLVLTRVFESALRRVSLPLPLYVALLVVISYGPALAWWWYASGALGTGHRRNDVGLIMRRRDLGWGPLTWLVCFLSMAVVGSLVVTVGIPFTSNTQGIADGRSDTEYLVAMVVLAVVVAPVAEEIVFRGMVLRGLLSRWPAPAAIAAQAVLFGTAHLDPAWGAGNVGLIIVLSVAGAVFGTTAYLCRRIAPSIIAHAILNALAIAAALAGAAN
ncbi:MAG: CPBP family intramembrane glutamic endopeptidase [Ilumatobacteraceae bacterium]